jgi:hypothetical protein
VAYEPSERFNAGIIVSSEYHLEDSENLKRGGDSIKKTLREAITETTGHIGALLMPMGLSVSLGG